jgi:DNA-directed RNA polymerase alpha subunit
MVRKTETDVSVATKEGTSKSTANTTNPLPVPLPAVPVTTTATPVPVPLVTTAPIAQTEEIEIEIEIEGIDQSVEIEIEIEIGEIDQLVEIEIEIEDKRELDKERKDILIVDLILVNRVSAKDRLKNRTDSNKTERQIKAKADQSAKDHQSQEADPVREDLKDHIDQDQTRVYKVIRKPITSNPNL